MNSPPLVGLLPDPALKGVARLLAEGGAHRFRRAVRDALGIDGPMRITAVKQRIGQRAVLRVESAEDPEKIVWYVKLQRRRLQPDQFARQRAIYEIGELAGVAIPRPVAVLPRFRATILASIGGSPILRPETPRTAYALAGEAIASLHDRLPPLGPVRRDRFEGARVDQVGCVLADIRPDLRDRFDSAAGDWWGDRTRPTARVKSILTLHGDFHPSQLHFDRAFGDDGPAIGILDWDEVCQGDPERDIGNFEAHLILEECRDPGARICPRDLGEAFAAGYTRIRATDPELRAWYRRGSLLRLAGLHADPNFGARPPNDPELPGHLIERSRSE